MHAKQEFELRHAKSPFDKEAYQFNNAGMIRTLLYKRRTKRVFEKKEIEPDKIRSLIEALLLSPTSRNLTPWEFIIVDEPETIQKLSSAKAHGSSLLAGAPLAVVIAADSEKSDVWIEDCSIASIILQLAAEDMGLGSCWVQIRNRTTETAASSEDYIKEICGLPSRFGVVSIVAVGYPAEKKPPHEQSELQFEKVHKNRFNTPIEDID